MPTSDGQLRVLLGIGGGIAAYKAVQVASSLTQAGFAVYVAMTRAAQQFVTPVSFAGVTGRRVVTEMFAPPAADDRESIYPHLYPATEADLFVLLPCTANLIGKAACGIADDVVTTAALSLPRGCRRFYCPAMNVEMWNQPVVQANAARLDELGWQRIGPAAGHLACGTEGFGRMSEPADIVKALLADCRGPVAYLTGRRVLITSGPTVEHLDPVRFLSNHSSGLMGRALAEAAVHAGATVDLVTGPVPTANLPTMAGIRIHRVTSAAEMLATAESHFAAADVAIFAAAVADYTAAEVATGKRPKEAQGFSLKLVPTADVAGALGARKRPGQLCCGFALETDDGPAKARDKLHRKHLDAIVLNTPASFGADDGHFTLIAADSEDDWGQLPKRDCARRLLAHLAGRLA